MVMETEKLLWEDPKPKPKRKVTLCKDREVMDIYEASDYLRISKDTIMELTRKGFIGHSRTSTYKGAKLLYTKKDLDAFLAYTRVKPCYEMTDAMERRIMGETLKDKFEYSKKLREIIVAMSEEIEERRKRLKNKVRLDEQKKLAEQKKLDERNGGLL